jgi:hypothetical protein
VRRNGSEPAQEYTFDYTKIYEERISDGRAIWHAWERKEVRAGFWSEILKQRDCLKYSDLNVDNIKMDFKHLK